MDDVKQPIKAIKALYNARTSESDPNFGVPEHFAKLIASGAKVRYPEI